MSSHCAWNWIYVLFDHSCWHTGVCFANRPTVFFENLHCPMLSSLIFRRLNAVSLILTSGCICNTGDRLFLTHSWCRNLGPRHLFWGVRTRQEEKRGQLSGQLVRKPRLHWPQQQHKRLVGCVAWRRMHLSSVIHRSKHYLWCCRSRIVFFPFLFGRHVVATVPIAAGVSIALLAGRVTWSWVESFGGSTVSLVVVVGPSCHGCQKCLFRFPFFVYGEEPHLGNWMCGVVLVLMCPWTRISWRPFQLFLLPF